MQETALSDTGFRLLRLERKLVEIADDLGLLLVYDRPERATERPGLARTYFAQRCVSDQQLDAMIDAFRSVGAFVELFKGERPFIEALVDGRIQGLDQKVKIAYNGIGWGIASDGFKPGRKALIPLLADTYGLVCANSNAYACALTVHKFDSFLVLEGLGVQIPRTWHYRPHRGWIGRRPPNGTRVIAKSTYEAWSVGVTMESVFHMERSSDSRIERIADQIGQAVTVQEFIPGVEVCVPVISCPEPIVTPPMEAVMARAPNDPDAIMTIDDNLSAGGVSHRPFVAPDAVMESLSETALRIFEVFDLQGLSRIDFRVDAEGCPWVFDVAIDPGVGRKSSAILSLAELGLDYASSFRAAVAATLATEGLI